MDIRAATEDEHELLVDHYLALWDSYGTPADHYRADARAQVHAFLAAGRRKRELGAFLAVEGEAVAGSAICQLHISPYPEVIDPRHRLFGYILSVFVDARFRRRGVGRRLMASALAHLRELGCTTAVLHASAAGEPLYEELGFTPAREMRLAL